MLKTISRFTSSFAALLSEQNTVIDMDGRVEYIRAAMLRALSAVDRLEANQGPKAWTDISRAHDIQTLWYLRSDLLSVLSECSGEQVAREQMDAITEFFRGSVPKNQMPGTRRMGR
jgi:hypothetical protein